MAVVALKRGRAPLLSSVYSFWPGALQSSRLLENLLPCAWRVFVNSIEVP